MGVGAAIAAGSHEKKGNCADLVIDAEIKHTEESKIKHDKSQPAIQKNERPISIRASPTRL